MSDLLDRLRKRRYPWLSTTAYAGNIASAAYMAPQSGTFTVDSGKPDADIDDAIKEIERLTAELAEAVPYAGLSTAALTELVKLKALKDELETRPLYDDRRMAMQADYNARKPKAWAAARDVLKQQSE